MKNTQKPIIGVTFGDAAGIGSEVVVKALQCEEIREMATWVLIGDERVFQQGEQVAGLSLNYRNIRTSNEVTPEDNVCLIDLNNLNPASFTFGVLSLETGRVSGETLKYALDLAKDKSLEGIIYAPLNKEALHRGGFHFKDEIHFFADLLGCKEGFSEINVMDDLWVTRVTSHVPLKEVSALVTKQRVGEIIRFAHNTLTRAGYNRPRIAVAALNPHAGDGGLIGKEEIEEIIPAVKDALSEGINVVGPYPADTIFLRLKNDPFDCLVGMYHDQVQTGMKIIGFFKGITLSGGLPVVLATPAHGTAFDISGKNKADPGAMANAMKMAVRLAIGKRKQ